jgi:hypothetical protein
MTGIQFLLMMTCLALPGWGKGKAGAILLMMQGLSATVLFLIRELKGK